MFSYDKFLQFPIKLKNKNPKLATIIATQYGGPNGELGASLRYLSQRYVMPDEVSKALLTDIGTCYPKFSYLCKKKLTVSLHPLNIYQNLTYRV